MPVSLIERVMRIVLIVLCVGALVLIVWGGIYMLKGRYDRGVATKARAVDSARVEKQTTLANEQMAVEVVRDVRVIQTQKEELRSAAIEKNDGLTARQRRGCVILRQQGQDIAGIPTCRSLAR